MSKIDEAKELQKLKDSIENKIIESLEHISDIDDITYFSIEDECTFCKSKENLNIIVDKSYYFDDEYNTICNDCLKVVTDTLKYRSNGDCEDD